MTSNNDSVIISEADNLDNNSVELVATDEIEQHELVQQHQVTDNSGLNYTTVPLEILEVAGIDIENSGELTEEQINTIMSLIEPNGTTQQHQHNLKQQQSDMQQSSYDNSMPSSSSETSDRLTLYILDDGSLKLTDAALQKEFFNKHDFQFTRGELALHNIDADNLTDESLQRIIQMAMESNEVMTTKRRRVDDIGYAGFAGSRFSPNTSITTSASAASRRALVNEEHNVDPQLSLIGSEVEIKRDGKIYSATIKYCRQNGGYKVQFSDGHFEWVTEDEIRLLHDETSDKRSDHESYSERTETASSGGISGSTVSKNINGRRCISQIPGIKVTASNGCHKPEEPNFCCVVCDRKVYQKEPQYIVIRIPACDKCAEQKMILLDGATKDCEVQTCASVVKDDRIVSAANDEQKES